MQDSTLLILGVCGLSVVCIGLVAVIAVFVFRVTGSRLIGALGSFSSALGRDEEDRPKPRLRRRPDLRAIADAQDFNAAVAKNIVTGQSAPSADAPIPPESAPTPTRFRGHRRDDFSPNPGLSERRRDYDDEIFGGMLDLDGDGDPDI
jgi:hypothetical protein